MAPVDDELFDDEYEEEDEEYEYEDDDEDEGFEEFEDDFEAGSPAEVRVKTVPGMDAFALGWAFFATIAAVCLITSLVLYEVYDWEAFGILPEKEPPQYPTEITVLGLGRDDAISDSVNYVMLNRGLNHELLPGTVVYISSPHYSGRMLTAIVSDEVLGNIAKAYIVDVNFHDQALPEDAQLIATNFNTKTDPYLAMRDIWLTRGAPHEELSNLSAQAADWNEQRIVRNARERNYR